MRIPVIRGVIDRRILVNYRVDPEALRRLLPEPFRPKLVHGAGMAGICLIRLRQIRPRFFPSFVGISSENAAHRIAVEWESQGELREGVYVIRRDTSSRLNSIAGGKVFPGIHHHARFQVDERKDHYRIVMDSDDGDTHVVVNARATAGLPATSTFSAVDEASKFFERGSLGYSPAAEAGTYDGLELRSYDWHVEPLTVEQVESSFFENRELFPAGSTEFDCALLMRGVQHDWRARETLRNECACA